MSHNIIQLLPILSASFRELSWRELEGGKKFSVGIQYIPHGLKQRLHSLDKEKRDEFYAPCSSRVLAKSILWLVHWIDIHSRL